jgi:hypothetical protein
MTLATSAQPGRKQKHHPHRPTLTSPIHSQFHSQQVRQSVCILTRVIRPNPLSPLSHPSLTPPHLFQSTTAAAPPSITTHQPTHPPCVTPRPSRSAAWCSAAAPPPRRPTPAPPRRRPGSSSSRARGGCRRSPGWPTRSARSALRPQVRRWAGGRLCGALAPATLAVLQRDSRKTALNPANILKRSDRPNIIPSHHQRPGRGRRGRRGRHRQRRRPGRQRRRHRRRAARLWGHPGQPRQHLPQRDQGAPGLLVGAGRWGELLFRL